MRVRFLLSDHELLYDQAVGEYQKGHLQIALALFEKAHLLKSSLYNGFINCTRVNVLGL